MTINILTEEGKAVVALEGRLDTVTAPELEEKLNEFGDSIIDLVFDFSNLEYISSAGLRVMLLSQKKMNKIGHMKIINACDDIKDIFEMTGFSDIIDIE